MDTRARIAVVFLAALAVPAGARAQSYSAPTPNYFIQKPLQQVIKTSPQVNSVYSQPMQRTNEIPLYGRNKGAYFYAQPKRDEGLFSGGGLYAFGAISAGDTVGGINMERAVNLVPYIGSEANDTMGTATGYTIGVGRNLSSTLGVEFSFTDFSGMKYGAANKIYSEIEGYDEEENPIYTTEVTENFELTSGGEISSQFLAVGFNYRLGNLFGTLLGGMLKPYVGFQVGYAMNTLSDYTFDDENGYSDGDLYNWYDDDENSETYEETLISLDYCTGQNDLCTQVDYVAGAITYMGKTTRTLGYALEAGLTLSLDSNLELDFFYKRNILGTVSNTGNMLSTYYELATDWYDNPGTCAAGFGAIDTNNGEPICMIEYPEEVVDTRTERVIESGKVNINQFGVKLKYFF